MDVHHHTDHATQKKKWTEYLLDFFMLFLAVFLGFLVENWREHIGETTREKEYIESFIEDLKLDTASINTNIGLRANKIKTLDSLIQYLNNTDPNQHSQLIYFWARQLTRSNRFLSSDRTIKQLKNSGGLRLIKNLQASYSIIAYDEDIDRFYYFQNRQTEEILTVSPLMGKLLDPNVLETMIAGQSIKPPEGNPPLRSVDRNLILDFIYDVHQLKSSDVYLIAALNHLKERATGIIVFLKNEFHLVNSK